MFRLLARFERGIGRKRLAGFFNFNRLRHIGQRDQFETPGGQQLGQFDPLLTITGAEDELHGTAKSRQQAAGSRR